MANTNTIIGVSLALVGGVIQSLGFVLQKKGHNILTEYLGTKNDLKLDAVHKEDKVSITTIPMWWCGIIMYQIGNLMRAIALSFAAQSIIAPLLAFNIAVNSVFTHFILKEKIKRMDMFSILFIIIGIVMIVVFGPSHGDDTINLTVSDLGALFEQKAYILCVSILSAIVTIIFIICKYIEAQNFNSSNNRTIVSGTKFLLFAWTFIAGFLRANNTVFVKSLITIIKSSFLSTANLEQNASDYLTYCIAFVWVICLMGGEYFRQRALSYFGATFVVPLDCAVYVILSVFLGAVFFNELSDMDSVLQICLFFGGLLVTVGAALMLGYGTGRSLDEIYSTFIKVSYIDPKKVYYKQPKIAVFGGAVAFYFSNLFLKEIPFFVNKTLKNIELEIIADGSPADPDHKKKPSVRPSFSWANMDVAQREMSQEHLESKLTWVSPVFLSLVISIFIFAKLEISFYRFGAVWCFAAQFGLLFFLYRGYQCRQLCEVRGKLRTIHGFTDNISFSVGCELLKDKPITSVCRFAGVRGSTQEMLFALYLLGLVAITAAMLAMKAAERGSDLFTNTGKWDKGRRTDVMLLTLFPLVISLTFLYIIAVVEHGTVGHNIHILCGLVSNLSQPISFMVYQNFSPFGISCMVISILLLVGYKINANLGPDRSDDCAVVHKWSLRNLTVETVMIVWAGTVAAMLAWSMDGDVIYFA